MRPVLLVLLAAGALAGCGSEETSMTIERDTPAITSPDTSIPYEAGGADGSGADGNSGDVDQEPRGGVAAGPDSSDERK